MPSTYPLQKAVLVCLISLLLVGMSVRSLASSAEIALYLMFLVTAGVFAVALFVATRERRGDITDPIHRLAWQTVFLWMLIAFCLAYGLLLSSWATQDMYTSASFGMRLVPIALMPAFAFAIRTESEWFKLLVGMVLIGTASALIDVRVWFGSADQVPRLSSADFSSIDYFYGLITALALVLLVPMKRTVRLLLVAALPILLLRVFISLIRAWYIIAALVLTYCIVVSWRWLPGGKSRTTIFLLSSLVFALGLIYFVPVDETIASYISTYDARFALVDSSLQYRWSEISSAMTYGGFVGAGWGAEGDFEDALQFTTATEYNTVKAYVHNFAAFMVWKLGLLGLVMVVLLATYILRHSLLTVRDRDPLGFVVIGLWIAWTIHSQVNMNFARPELSIWAAAWLGYFQWRSLWRPVASSEVEPRSIRSAAPTLLRRPVEVRG